MNLGKAEKLNEIDLSIFTRKLNGQPKTHNTQRLTHNTKMNINTKEITIEKPAQETFDFLNDVSNFEKLMPENISKFEVLEDDTFLFALKGMPEIVLKKKEATAPNKLVYGAGGGKIDFNLTGNITAVDENTSKVTLEFNGDFNPMMAMVIKKPITNFLDTLRGNLPNAL